MLGDVRESLLVGGDLVLGIAIDAIPWYASKTDEIGFATVPRREKCRHHFVTHGKLAHCAAHRRDHTRGIRQQYPLALNRQHAHHHAQIMKINRIAVYGHADFMRLRGGCGFYRPR